MKEIHQYPTVIQSIASIRTDLDSFAELSKLPRTELRQITMIVEELFSKIIRFGFQETKDQLVEITLFRNDKEIIIEMKDQGVPYNPLESSPDEMKDPASIDEGGMGLSLIRAFCDSIHYTRVNDHNILYIQKYFRGQTETE